MLTLPTTTEAALAAAFPATVSLGYVDYDDRLSDEHIQKCLDGKMLDVENELLDLWFDDRCGHEDTEIRDAAQALGIDPGEVDDETREAVRGVLWERDDFDPFTELLRHTRRRMFRLAVPDPDEPTERLATLHGWEADAAERTDDAVRIARGLRIGDDHLDWIEGVLVEVGDMGSEVFVLWYGDVADVVKPLMDEQFVDAKHRATFRAGSAGLLVFGRWNGSGYVESELPADVTLPLELGWVELDHRAGPGWSYSDDVAGLVYSAFEADPLIERQETGDTNDEAVPGADD